MKRSRNIVNQRQLHEYKVSENARLIDFLIQTFPGKSRNNIKSLLSKKLVLVDGAPVSQFDFEVVKGDIIQISPVSVNQTKQKASKLKILFEDDNYLVINKPAGLLSVATDKEKTITAYRLCMDYVRETDPKARIFVTHRIDKETSGVLLFAKNEKLRNVLQDNWNDLVIARQYVALIEGNMDKDEGTIVTWLRETKTNLMYSSHKKGDGQKAVTKYKVIEKNEKYSLLDVHIETGRKNQIRVHFKESGHPIVGDEKYMATSYAIGRLGLHARKLVLKCPLTNEILTFVANEDDIFTKVFKKGFVEMKKKEKETKTIKKKRK